MDKLQKRLREVEEEHAAEIVDGAIQQFDQRDRDALFVLLGRIQAVDSIANTLSAQAIRALEQIEETKAWRPLGHKNFVEFLNHLNISGLTKSRYYEKKRLLDREGDPLFDIMTVAGVPMASRKLLGDGDVRIEGDFVIIRTNEEEEVQLSKSNLAGVVTVVNSLAADKRKLKEHVEKLSKENKQKDQTIKAAHEDLDRLKGHRLSEIGKDPHSMALANVAFAFQALRDEAGRLTENDRSARRNNVFEIIAHQLQLTREAYGFAVTAGERTPALEGQSFGEVVDGFLENLELEDNDAELAASL